MKKYLKLTSRQAISHFILGDDTLAPESSDEIKQKLNSLNDLKSDISVSITLPTHRTKPDYLADAVVLKNMINKVEKELQLLYQKREYLPIVENLHEAQNTVGMDLNLDSLVVFANEHFSSVVKLPVTLDQSYTIGKYFNTVPLYKVMQQSQQYYVMTVSKQRIRLIEAFNDKALREITEGDFPFEKDSFYEVRWDRPAADGFGDSMEKEFYNDADKSFKTIYNLNPLPVVLVGDVKSISYYEEQMDDNRMVIARANGSFDEAPLHEIMKVVEPEVLKYRESEQKSSLDQIDNASSSKLLVTDIREIIQLAEDGGIDTLFVGNSFSLSNDQNLSTGTPEEKSELRRKTDDMFLEILNNVSHSGGKIVFMEDDKLDQYGGIVASARFKLSSEE